MNVWAETLRAFFVVGVVVIPILYWLLGRVGVGSERDRRRDGTRRAERERRGEGDGPSREANE